MKTNVWIWNHYAGNMFYNKSGRHYYFSKYLIQAGYNPTIFCANTLHYTNEKIKIDKSIYYQDVVNKVPFVFIKSTSYKNNNIFRIFNLIIFAINLKRTAKKYMRTEKPDVIIASSPHLLTCVIALFTAKKYKVPCIIEIRDRWPDAIVSYLKLSNKNIIIRFLYNLEKWIYKKSNKLIFTIEGGKEYIISREWNKEINVNKVFYINNGIDIEEFDENAVKNAYMDIDLDNENLFKVIYIGSIRKANNLKMVIEAAQILESKNKNIVLLIYGDGNERQILQEEVNNMKLKNILFKGWAESKNIPFILKKGDACLFHIKQNSLQLFGSSPNKMFNYLPSEKPIISTIDPCYNIIKRYNCGISINHQSPQEIANAIISIAMLEKERYKEYARNARQAAYDFDFKILTKKLIEIIEE